MFFSVILWTLTLRCYVKATDIVQETRVTDSSGEVSEVWLRYFKNQTNNSIDFAVGAPLLCSEHGFCDSCTKDSCVWCPVDNRCHRARWPAPCSLSDLIIKESFCPAPAPPQTGFDLDLAHYVALYSDAAYYDDPASCPDGWPANTDVIKTFNYTLGLWNTAFGFVAHDRSLRRIVVAFRGTASMTQVFEELLHHNLIPFDKKDPEALVNEFPQQAAENMLPDLKKAMLKLGRKCPDCQILFTGHSLGASLATLAAYEVVKWKDSLKPKIYTFGQPRVGNAAFAALVDNVLPEFYRLVNAADPVPHVPFCIGNNSSPLHSCTREGYFHAGLEIWFPSGDYRDGLMCGHRHCVEDPRSEDPTCSNGLVNEFYPGSIADHHGYWKVIHNGFCGSKNQTLDSLFV